MNNIIFQTSQPSTSSKPLIPSDLPTLVLRHTSWLAPCLHGRYCEGGTLIEHKLSACPKILSSKTTHLLLLSLFAFFSNFSRIREVFSVPPLTAPSFSGRTSPNNTQATLIRPPHDEGSSDRSHDSSCAFSVGGFELILLTCGYSSAVSSVGENRRRRGKMTLDDGLRRTKRGVSQRLERMSVQHQMTYLSKQQDTSLGPSIQITRSYILLELVDALEFASEGTRSSESRTMKFRRHLYDSNIRTRKSRSFLQEREEVG